MKNNRYIPAVLGGIVLLVIVGFLILSKAPDTQQGANDSASTDESSNAINVAVLGSVLPEDWARYANAVKDIQFLTPGETQTMEFYVVDDPTNGDISYFATSAYNSDTKIQQLSIYKYAKAAFAFERIYKKSYTPGSADWMSNANGIPVWHLVAYDHGKLVVLAQDIDDSPGRCAEPFLLSEGNESMRRLFALDLQNPTAGLAPYSANQTLIDEARAKESNCLKTVE